MAEKVLNTRIVNKHDTQENWDKAENFIPKIGEIIVYDTDSNYSYPRIKIGNASNNVKTLPFVFEPVTRNDIDLICGNAT